MSFQKKMPVFPKPAFIVPRYGEVTFIPVGDVPLRKTTAWQVEVRFTSAGRKHLDMTFRHESPHGETPYPTAEIARQFLCQACSEADGLPSHHYYDQQIVPPLRPPPAPFFP